MGVAVNRAVWVVYLVWLDAVRVHGAISWCMCLLLTTAFVILSGAARAVAATGHSSFPNGTAALMCESTFSAWSQNLGSQRMAMTALLALIALETTVGLLLETYRIGLHFICPSGLQSWSPRQTQGGPSGQTRGLITRYHLLGCITDEQQFGKQPSGGK